MSDRGWLGYSRRWFGAQQVPPAPVAVVRVGIDEPDGGWLHLAEAVNTPGAASAAGFRIWARERDVMIEALGFATTSGATACALQIVDDVPVAALPPNVAVNMRTGSTEPVTQIHGGALPAPVGATLPVGFNVFASPLVLTVGTRLTIVDTIVGNFTATLRLLYREGG